MMRDLSPRPLFLVTLLLWIGAVSACGQRGEAPTAPMPPTMNEPANPTDTPGPRLGETEWLIVLADRIDPESFAQELGLQHVRGDRARRLHVMAGDLDAGRLPADPRMVHVERNQEVAVADPLDITLGFNEGGVGEGGEPAQDGLANLDLPQLHGLATGAGVRVAVIDTGVDPHHPMLAGRVEFIGGATPPLGGIELELGNGLDDDGDGEVDEAHGHGTHVAGLAVTVAPDITILPIRVLNDDGVGRVYDLAVALYMARDARAQLINLSLSLSQYSPMISHVLAELVDSGIQIVAAAGNAPGDPRYPASDPNTLSVAAVDELDVLADFSASGAVDLSMPGVLLLSAYPGGGAAAGSGTSMACGVASGALATVLGALGNGDGIAAAEILRHHTAPMQPATAVLHGRANPVAAVLSLGS